jgi:hypothetical protein
MGEAWNLPASASPLKRPCGTVGRTAARRRYCEEGRSDGRSTGWVISAASARRRQGERNERAIWFLWFVSSGSNCPGLNRRPGKRSSSLAALVEEQGAAGVQRSAGRCSGSDRQTAAPVATPWVVPVLNGIFYYFSISNYCLGTFRLRAV